MENYKQKYEQAFERAKSMYEQGMMPERIEYIFPELKESENERIRKELIMFLECCQDTQLIGNRKRDKWILWLEKQGKQLYIRFGEIPTDEKSKIYRGEIEVGTENGVSVYPAFKTKEGDIVLWLNLPITKTTLYTQQHLLEYDNRPCYLVEGDYVGKDTDGQPLINNVNIIEKIDSYKIKEEKQCEPTWSEEDEDSIDIAIKIIQSGGDNCAGILDSDKALKWLQSLKQRLNGYGH
jgi:hypothetical protein